MIEQQVHVEPTEVDILCGPGRSLYEHSGNVRFRLTVAKYSKAYHEASRKAEKMSICKQIRNEVLSTGARFLKKVFPQGEGKHDVQAPRLGTIWSVVPNPKKVACDKISHSLREMMRAGSPYEIFSKQVNQKDVSREEERNRPSSSSYFQNNVVGRKVSKMTRRLSTPGRIESMSGSQQGMDDPFFQVRSIEEMIAQPDSRENLPISFLATIANTYHKDSENAFDSVHLLSSCEKVTSGPLLQTDFDGSSSTSDDYSCWSKVTDDAEESHEDESSISSLVNWTSNAMHSEFRSNHVKACDAGFTSSSWATMECGASV